MHKKFDLEGAADLEVAGALAVGRRDRRQKSAASIEIQDQMLLEVLRSLVGALKQSHGEIHAGTASVRLEQKAGRTALLIKGL